MRARRSRSKVTSGLCKQSTGRARSHPVENDVFPGQTVRAGALTLAIGGIIGGNTFDVLFIAVSDVVYQRGSLYEAVVASDLLVLGWMMLLTGILGAGLIRRQRAWIGFEGFATSGGYIVGLFILWQM